MAVTKCFYEPVRGAGNERRDELGNTAPYRKHPHLGEDWGFSNGSEGKDIWAIHAGKVTKVWNDPALGWSLTTIIPTGCECGFGGFSIEYNHMLKQPTLKVGDEVKGGWQTVIGLIGATGSALSASGANHLHASMGKAAVPHTLPLDKKVAMFPLCTSGSAERKAFKLAQNPEGMR